MDKLKEALWSDYNANSACINELTITSQEYRAFVDERDKIRNELIKTEQIIADKEMNKLKIESENRNEKIRNNITIGTFAISTIVSVFAIIKTFRFDEDATVTSTLGRNILNNATKIFKH